MKNLFLRACTRIGVVRFACHGISRLLASMDRYGTLVQDFLWNVHMYRLAQFRSLVYDYHEALRRKREFAELSST